MLKTSVSLLGKKVSRFPFVVSYHKLPWEVLAPESTQTHEYLASHYAQLLQRASTTALPELFLSQHIAIPEDRMLRLLPGTLYVLPGPASTPHGVWEERQVTDPASVQYYGTLLHHGVEFVSATSFISSNLRVYCNAVTLLLTGSQAAAPRSSMEALQAEGDGVFTIYQFYRPNRPLSELTQPLMKLYQHTPSLQTLDGFANQSSWTPKLDAPRRAPSTKVKAMKPFVPPQSYLMGLAERKAVIPGSAFGRRSLMWGHWF